MNTATAIHSATLSFASLPALGVELAGGTFRGITTLKDGTHCAVILLPNKAQERMNWQQTKEWAEAADGVMLTRPVGALLYANAKDHFEPTLYWTSEELQTDTGDESDASCAWYCLFDIGGQGDYHKSAEGAAVAVRLIPLTA